MIRYEAPLRVIFVNLLVNLAIGPAAFAAAEQPAVEALDPW